MLRSHTVTDIRDEGGLPEHILDPMRLFVCSKLKNFKYSVHLHLSTEPDQNLQLVSQFSHFAQDTQHAVIIGP